MKTKFLLLILSLACVVSGQSSSHQGEKRARTLADYQPATLKALAAAHSDSETSLDRKEGSVIQGDIVPSRVRAYVGSPRTLPQNKKDVIAGWARRFAGMPEFYTAPYQNEVLFTEGGVKYWLAVRKEFLPRFEEELKEGQAVDLYLIQLGRIKAGTKWTPVLLVEAFGKPEEKKP